MQNRKDEKILFEYDLHKFHWSEDFALMYWDNLPGRIAEYHPGCVMICLCLSRMHAEWLRDTLTAARKERNPEMFMERWNHELTVVEENSEVNRFVDAMKRFKDDTNDKNEHRCEMLNQKRIYKRQKLVCTKQKVNVPSK